jgi:hypothetical protein
MLAVDEHAIETHMGQSLDQGRVGMARMNQCRDFAGEQLRLEAFARGQITFQEG